MTVGAPKAHWNPELICELVVRRACPLSTASFRRSSVRRPHRGRRFGRNSMPREQITVGPGKIWPCFVSCRLPSRSRWPLMRLLRSSSALGG